VSGAPRASVGARQRAPGGGPRAPGSGPRTPGSTTTRLAAPAPAEVRTGARGVPAAVGGTRVEAVREEWVVEDRWWTRRPLRRRYFEVVLDDGRDVVVFRDAVRRRWFSQRG
jgi:hypothetical protein